MSIRIFRRNAVFIISATLASAILVHNPVIADAPTPTVKKLNVESPTHVLFVGNSYLYYGDSVHNHVRRIVIESGLKPKKKLKYKSATISGSALHDHIIDSYLDPTNLRVNKPFQVVILQGGSALGWSRKRPSVFGKTVAAFAKKIAAAGGETALYMTQAYVEPHKRADPDMTVTLEKYYVEVGNANGALVIPVGLAFAEAYKRKPDVRLHKMFDGSHPNLLGTFLAANVVYASLYGTSPVGNGYDYFGKISKEDVAFLQQVAQDTVAMFLGR
jgi:hypothetical protein